MKSFIVAILLIGAVSAQAPATPEDVAQARLVAEILVKRGELLFESAWKQVEELRAQGHGHLLQAFENEAALVEALTVDLKIQIHDLNKTHEIHHLHVIEEELLHRENRLSEEMAIIKAIQQNHKPTNQTNTQLLAKGEELLKKANEALAKLPHSRESFAIEAETFAIEDLIKAIREKPNSPDLKNEEAQLARHEQTLEQLLQRIAKKP